MGNEILYPVLGARRVTFWLGSNCRYEFTLLATTAREFPDKVAIVLQAKGWSG